MAEGLILKSGSSGDLDLVTATPADIRKGKIGINGDGDAITGLQESRGTLTRSINAGDSVEIPAGIYDGGRVTANSLASQTQGDAMSNHILSGKTAWVNGNKVDGTLTVTPATNFNVAQYGHQSVICSWARPGAPKMWSGIRIEYKTNEYPRNPGDGTLLYEGNGSSAYGLKTGAGLRYFSAWSYLTTSDGRIYSKVIHNLLTVSSIQGVSKFADGRSKEWVVPAYVRSIDIFCVGGGAGHHGVNDSDQYYRSAFPGGAGGFTAIKNGIPVTPGEKLNINIGAGGIGASEPSRSWATAVAGGTTSVYRGNQLILSASGAKVADGLYGPAGSNGGSGGGDKGNDFGWDSDGTRRGGQGGADGSNGYTRSTSGTALLPNSGGRGLGQHSTTRDWFGTIYAGGGGGGCSTSGGAGGAGGGGTGSTGNGSGSSGTNGLGGGAGGGCCSNGYFGPANGGYGAVVIRWGY